MLLDRIPTNWKPWLIEEFSKPYFSQLQSFIEASYTSGVCYPSTENLFRALELCSPFEVKVVLLGQDPYHGEGEAHGLSFSVPDGIPLPPSLRNVFKELESDLGISYRKNGNLTFWAEQGVLLLNTVLTVEANKAGSHRRKGWEEFTDAIIRLLSDKRKHLVFLLWGSEARKKQVLIDSRRHLVLQCGHPSPLSANRGHWFGNGHFSKTNQYLKEKGYNPINW